MSVSLTKYNADGPVNDGVACIRKAFVREWVGGGLRGRDLTNECKKGITPIVHGGVLPRTDTLGSGKTLNTPNLRPNLPCLGICHTHTGLI